MVSISKANNQLFYIGGNGSVSQPRFSLRSHWVADEKRAAFVLIWGIWDDNIHQKKNKMIKKNSDLHTIVFEVLVSYFVWWFLEVIYNLLR